MSRIIKLKIGLASCGIAAGGDAVLEALKKATDLPIAEVGCIGHCYAEPLVEACLDDGSSVMYGNVKADEKSIANILFIFNSSFYNTSTMISSGEYIFSYFST